MRVNTCLTEYKLQIAIILELLDSSQVNYAIVWRYVMRLQLNVLESNLVQNPLLES